MRGVEVEVRIRDWDDFELNEWRVGLLERPIMKTLGLRGGVGVDVDMKKVRMRMYIEKMGVILGIEKHLTRHEQHEGSG